MIDKALIYYDKWTFLSNDYKQTKKVVSSFFMPASSDGFGFKYYRNKSNNAIIVKIIGTLQNAKLSKFSYLKIKVYPESSQNGQEIDLTFYIERASTVVIFWTVQENANVRIIEFARVIV